MRSLCRLQFSAAAALLLTSSAFAQCELNEVQIQSLWDSDLVGWSVAIEGQITAVGAIGSDFACPSGSDCNMGAAIVDEVSPAGTFTRQVLAASDAQPGDQFGQHVSLSASRLAVGSHFAPGGGKAYVFTRTAAGAWVEEQILQPADVRPMFHFGHSLELDGNTLLVGCMQDDHAGDRSGSAYVFRRAATGWVQQDKLTASDAAPVDLFGRATSLDGSVAIVGCHFDDEFGNNSGAAYVYERDDNGTPQDPADDTWPEVVKLTASAATADEQFGLAVAVHDAVAVVGAPRAKDLTGMPVGAVFVFVRSGGVWGEVQRITPLGVEPGDNFGESLSLHGPRLIVGAPGDGDGGVASGAAYLFERTTLGFVETGKYVSSAAAPGELTGREMSVEVHGDRAVVGSPARHGTAAQSGAATILDLRGCLGDVGCSGQPNSTGSVGTTSGRGSLLVAANDLTIEAANLPSGVFGLFVVSRDPGFTPGAGGAQGPLCLGGAIGRYNSSLQLTNASGSAGHPIDLTSIPTPTGNAPAAAGDLLFFQFWHRDVAQGVPTSNFTSSVQFELR